MLSALLSTEADAEWSESMLFGDDLAAPHLMPVEVANVLRRSALAGHISQDVASLAHADLQLLTVGLYPYEPFAERIWSLRSTITAYDAWYVALAESLGAELVTLDGRLARAPGPRCPMRTPS